RSDWNDRDDRDEPLETERLALHEDDAPLPWLESGDEEYEEEQGSDTGRILGLVILGLIALAAIVGGIWWATHRSADPALVADGSTIPAPEAPYKEAPSDPGGKTFDGTGDTSFAVSEGQTRPARLGEAAGAPSPSVDVGAKPAVQPSAAASAGAPALAPAAGGIGVQVGAFSTRALAEAGWAKLAGNPALSGVRHRIVEGQADIGTVYRLQAVAPDAASASALCGRLKASGVQCQVKN
ncbi:MAG: hypothetical protein RIQ46_717, partial [Pseudomonadota bacterium]